MAGSIKGNVMSQQDGQPLEGVAINLTGGGSGHETSSDAKGNFGFTDLAAGNDYEMTAQKEGFETGLYGPLVVVDNAETNLPIALEPKNL